MKQCFFTEKGPRAIGPYCTATRHGGCCYISGMLGLDPATGTLAGDDIQAQSRQAMKNIETVLGEMGLSIKNTLKTTVFLADLGDFGSMNTIYAEFFGPDYPARSCFQVAALPMGALVEIEAIVACE